ncbi:hypothetical protein Pcinc_026208 [Petrolisthes cinctipes]|uniref:Uncharacterized protein n=1 Tax=Petrolisthes cinctipes TaxID=88211 RepID=A0AAE1F7D4_PETCI|nr:hypothetical protein Pcinc_026208 [Petrolisthes cinctipes]
MSLMSFPSWLLTHTGAGDEPGGMLRDLTTVLVGGSRGLPPSLAFLFKLAWASRIRLPLLIAIAFMVTNIHLRLEINVNIEVGEDEALAEQAEQDEQQEQEQQEVQD